MDSTCPLLADIIPASSQKSVFKIRTKIHSNLIEFGMAILADPGRFMDSPAHCLLILFQLQAINQPSKFAQKFS